MNEITFNFTNENVRVILINSEPYFCVNDISKILDLTNAYRQISTFKKGVHTVHTPTSGGMQYIKYIDEKNLYRLIFKSRKENAKQFQDWVFDEVLPSIRKTGKYSIPESIKDKSRKHRNQLTDEWQKHGIKNPSEFARLTVKEYKELNFEKGKRKKDFNEGELLLVSALEAMESLKLFHDTEINGFNDCNKSIEETAVKVKSVTYNKNKELS